jgi:hypothetical protein
MSRRRQQLPLQLLAYVAAAAADTAALHWQRLSGLMCDRCGSADS